MATPNLGLVYLDVAQAQKEVSINAGWDVLDAAVVRKSGDTMTGQLKIQRAVVSTGNPNPDLWVVAPADTGMTASTEATDVTLDLSAIRQFATGALATQRAMRILAPTYAFVGASTITAASTVSISGAPIAGTNATITAAFALNIDAGTGLPGGIQVTAPSTGRCLTLNCDTGATIFVQPKSGTLFSNYKVNGAFQVTTDPGQTNTNSYNIQNLVSGSVCININTTDLVTIGTTNVSGGAVLGVSGGKAAFFGVTPVARVSAYTLSNHVASRSLNESTATLAQLANVVGTVISDLQSYGLLQ